MDHEFKVGDRLRSLRSGRIWVVVDTKLSPPKPLSEDCIPVRQAEWPVDKFCWQKPSIFEKAY